MPTQLHNTILLVTDRQCSVLNVLGEHHPHPIAYTAYGHRPWNNGLLSLLGFNGELPDPLTGHYLLGNGYRAFNPVLMRFNSPDSWSPFGKGGLNAYAYCVGDPLNRGDPTGHTPVWLKTILRSIGLMRGRTRILSSATPNTGGLYRNPMANTLHPFPNTKSPAWTTQDQLAFAGTGARHPAADDVISDLRARYGNGDLTTNAVGTISDPPPSYSQSFRPPPNYGNEPLPSYKQALVNAKQLKNLSKLQGLIRRRSL